MLAVLPLRARLAPTRAVSLPAHPGPLWRSALGARLHQDCCIAPGSDCSACGAEGRCAYGRLFEPASHPPPGSLLAQLPDPPRPYVIRPRHAGGSWAGDQTLELDITLIGRAANDMPAIRAALKRVQLRRAPFRLQALMAVPPNGDEPIDLAGRPGQRPWPIITPPVPQAVRVHLDHPLRLQRSGRLIGSDDLTPVVFSMAVLRRLSALYEQVTGRVCEVDVAEIKRRATEDIALVDAALHWCDARRYAGRQGQQVPVGGLLGAFVLRGPLEPLWPWLWAGQWVHAGKGAVMGLGAYRLQALNG